MKSCVYRNFYYLKESLFDFLKINKKRLFLSIIAIVLGISFGICIAIKNISNFSFINCSDKIIISFFCGDKAISFFIKKILECLLVVLIILIINNFSILAFLNYMLFAYLSFRLTINSIILCNMLKLTGILYVLLCYFLINITILFLYILLFLICKTSGESCGSSSKIVNYPYKSILMISFLPCLFEGTFMINATQKSALSSPSQEKILGPQPARI